MLARGEDVLELCGVELMLELLVSSMLFGGTAPIGTGIGGGGLRFRFRSLLGML